MRQTCNGLGEYDVFDEEKASDWNKDTSCPERQYSIRSAFRLYHISFPAGTPCTLLLLCLKTWSSVDPGVCMIVQATLVVRKWGHQSHFVREESESKTWTPASCLGWKIPVRLYEAFLSPNGYTWECAWCGPATPVPHCIWFCAICNDVYVKHQSTVPTRLKGYCTIIW